MKSTYQMLLGLAAALIVVTPSPVSAQPYTEAQAKVDVGELRNMYGVATDLIAAGAYNGGVGSDYNGGLEIYNRIFTADACIKFAPAPVGEGCFINGPAAWADFVSRVLANSEGARQETVATQHLLGSQVVEIVQLPRGNPGTSNASGHAKMSTYLQAWQVYKGAPPDDQGKDTLSLFIGTYFDSAVVTRGVGWQIEDMTLVGVSGETREIDE